MLSPREGTLGPDPLQPSCSHPRHQRWEWGGCPLPALPSHPLCISLYRTIFKMEAKTHYTLDRHAHTCTQASAPNGAERQLHSESTKECIRSPSWQGRQGLNPLVLTVRSSSLSIALLAARGRGRRAQGLCQKGGGRGMQCQPGRWPWGEGGCFGNPGERIDPRPQEPEG